MLSQEVTTESLEISHSKRAQKEMPMLRISIVCGNADDGGQEGGPRTALEDQEEQMHTCPSDCLFPVQNETLSLQNPLTHASGVRLIPAGHRQNRQHWGLHREQGRSHHRDNGGI